MGEMRIDVEKSFSRLLPKRKNHISLRCVEFGLSAISSHEYNNSEKRPIAYASKRI